MAEQRTLPTLTGKVLFAHPSRVAQADQIAAAEAIKAVELRSLVPTTHVYIVDLDELLKLPDPPDFIVRYR